MNWFKKATKFESYMLADGVCDHVLADHSKFSVCHIEYDSSGMVGSHALCEDCERARLVTITESDLLTCNDCKKNFLPREFFNNIKERAGADPDDDSKVVATILVTDWESADFVKRPETRTLGTGIEWTSWDHYPAQGDEELPICQDCTTAERHRRRLEVDARDRRNYADDSDDSGYEDECNCGHC